MPPVCALRTRLEILRKPNIQHFSISTITPAEQSNARLAIIACAQTVQPKSCSKLLSDPSKNPDSMDVKPIEPTPHTD